MPGRMQVVVLVRVGRSRAGFEPAADHARPAPADRAVVALVSVVPDQSAVPHDHHPVDVAELARADARRQRAQRPGIETLRFGRGDRPRAVCRSPLLRPGGRGAEQEERETGSRGRPAQFGHRSSS